MMKLSTSRLLTQILIALCVLMMIAVFVQKQFRIGTGYSVEKLGAVEIDPRINQALSENTRALGDAQFFQEIADRALFDKSRGPLAEAIVQVVTDSTKALPKAPLTAQLTGIVITPKTKVALLRAASGDQSFRLKEGQPFPGELAGWKVLAIAPRSVTFDGGDQGQTELKLDVSKGGPSSSMPMQMKTDVPFVAGNPPVMPPPPQAAVAVPNPNMPVMPPPPPVANAEQAAREAEVQKIIEERRAQMRAEAERMSAENQ